VTRSIGLAKAARKRSPGSEAAHIVLGHLERTDYHTGPGGRPDMEAEAESVAYVPADAGSTHRLCRSTRRTWAHPRGYELWPTSMQAIEQRCRDAPAASLRVRTAAAFAAWKTVAWHDRGAPRDLYDLWALAQRGAITAEAAALFVAHGPINRPLQPWMFASPPTEARWQHQLANQHD
jgi:hypothetical protein